MDPEEAMPPTAAKKGLVNKAKRFVDGAFGRVV